MEKTLEVIQKIFPDSVIYYIWITLLAISQGKAIDMSLINELGQKFSTSIRLYNLMGIALLNQGKR